MHEEILRGNAPEGGSGKAGDWKECRTLRELGNDRPSITEWFRFLAVAAAPNGIQPGPEPAVQA